MKYNLIKDGLKITNENIRVYDLPIQETGVFRGTLCIGDIVEIEEGLVKITDYNFHDSIQKGVYEYLPLSFYKSERIV